MQITPVSLWTATLLGPVATLLYQTPQNGKVTVKRAVFSNFSAAPVLLTIFKTPIQGVANNTNSVKFQWPLSPGEAYIAAEVANMVLESQEALYALASTAGVITSFGSGLQVQ